MLVVESIAVAVGIIVVASLAVWCLFTLVKITGMAKEERSNEAPYKVEPPKSTEQMAVPHKPIEWTFANALKPTRVFITPTEVRIAKKLGLPLEQFARELFKINEREASKPKRNYTKRSKYWTDKRKKAAARKAKKKTSKSK